MESAGSLGFVAALHNTTVGTAEEFNSIVNAHRPRIFRFALASLRDLDAAETVTQDCFLRAHKAWGQFRGESAIQSWLMQIAVNLVRDVVRNRRFQFWKRAKASSVVLDAASDWIPAGGISPEDRIIEKEQVDAIWRALEGLSEPNSG